jgi:hypothetical protein
MNNSKPTPRFAELIASAQRTPIHTYTYRDAIRAARPYIRFVYIDTDTLPTVADISLDRPDPYTHVVDTAARQPELHVHALGDSRQGNESRIPSVQAFTFDAQAGSADVRVPIDKQHVPLAAALNLQDQRERPLVQSLAFDVHAGSVEATIPIGKQHVSLDAAVNLQDRQERPLVQSLAFDAQAGSVEVTIPIGKQRVSLDIALNPKDQRVTPAAQSHELDTRAGAVEKTLSCTTLQPSLDVTFNPVGQRAKLTLLSLKQDKRAHSAENTISIVEQKASLSAVFEQKKHEETTISNTATRKEHQHDSYNHSLAVIEPRCHDYPVSKMRAGSRIVRYHRYSRASHISSSNTGMDFKLSFPHIDGQP